MDVYQRRRLVALSAVAAIFVILVLLIRSCGGDDEEGTPLTSSVPATTEPTTLSQEDFASQGDAICLDTNTSLDALESTDPTEDATDRAELIAGELSSLQSLTLAPGEPGENKLANFLASLQEQVQGYDDLITAIERDDAAVTEIEATIDEAAADAEEAAGRFGFEVCGDTSQVSESSGGEETDADGTAVPEAPVTTVPAAPTTTTPVTPPAEGGGATPEPAPPDDTGDTGGGSSDSGGLTP